MQVFTFILHLIHLFVTTFLALFLKVFSLQVKDVSSIPEGIHSHGRICFTKN
jgi:hypothetical protein